MAAYVGHFVDLDSPFLAFSTNDSLNRPKGIRSSEHALLRTQHEMYRQFRSERSLNLGIALEMSSTERERRSHEFAKCKRELFRHRVVSFGARANARVNDHRDLNSKR